MIYKSIEDLDLKGKRVLVRVDFNVPLDKETGQKITSDTRIRMALPTINYALKQGAAVILVSHLGRPDGQVNTKMSLLPVAGRLAELLDQQVKFTSDCIGRNTAEAVNSLQSCEVMLLENLRFHAEEEANDPDFSEELAANIDIYVNDAFGAAHRAHASTVGITNFMQIRAAGLLMQRELKFLSMAISEPRQPYLAIIGGAKISGKIDVIRNLLKLADHVLIGGAMTYTFLKAQGLNIGSSLVEEEKLDLARELLQEAGDRLVLPVDHVIAKEFSATSEVCTVKGEVPDGWMGLDVGSETIRLYESMIHEARMVVWNGPMGVFELEPFAQGTIAVAKAVEEASARCTSIVGGGDSEKAIKVAGVGDKITHISTGGGASLEFLGGKTLPGVAALQ